VDLTTFNLVGPCLTQGQGIVGNGFHLALIEEIGRYPGKMDVLLGKMYSWEMEGLVFSQIPIKFVAIPGIEETLDTEDGRICLTWQDLEKGMETGPHIEITPPGLLEDTEPIFVLASSEVTMTDWSVTDSGVAMSEWSG